MNIDESLWAEYERKLRDAYRTYHDTLRRHGISWYLSTHQNTSDDQKEKLEKLIEALPHPDKASLAEMIVIGWWGTSWHYESFYWCGLDGKTPKEFSQTALYELSNLTYHNRDPKLRPLIETVIKSARLADDIGRIIGK
jgi:hypothetical protein